MERRSPAFERVLGSPLARDFEHLVQKTLGVSLKTVRSQLDLDLGLAVRLVQAFVEAGRVRTKGLSQHIVLYPVSDEARAALQAKLLRRSSAVLLARAAIEHPGLDRAHLVSKANLGNSSSPLLRRLIALDLLTVTHEGGREAIHPSPGLDKLLAHARPPPAPECGGPG